jgi:hypothetical protein
VYRGQGKEAVVLVTGSVFVAAAVRDVLVNHSKSND